MAKARKEAGRQLGEKQLDSMSLADFQEHAKEAGVSADDLPEQFTGQVIAIDSRIDDYGRKVYDVGVEISELDGSPTTIKYTPMHSRKMKMGIAVGHVYRFVKQAFPIGFARHLPMEELTKGTGKPTTPTIEKLGK